MADPIFDGLFVVLNLQTFYSVTELTFDQILLS